jgi:hypothetical protein
MLAQGFQKEKLEVILTVPGMGQHNPNSLKKLFISRS